MRSFFRAPPVALVVGLATDKGSRTVARSASDRYSHRRDRENSWKMADNRGTPHCAGPPGVLQWFAVMGSVPNAIFWSGHLEVGRLSSRIWNACLARSEATSSSSRRSGSRQSMRERRRSCAGAGHTVNLLCNWRKFEREDRKRVVRAGYRQVRLVSANVLARYRCRRTIQNRAAPPWRARLLMLEDRRVSLGPVLNARGLPSFHARARPYSPCTE